MWLMKLLTELGISIESIELMEDSQNAMALVKNPISHARMKHMIFDIIHSRSS